MATAPQAAIEMPQDAGANPFADPNTMAVYDQMRQTVSPKEFGDEMLAGAAQIDPEAMAQFRNDLSQIDLSPEDLRPPQPAAPGLEVCARLGGAWARS